MDRIAALSKNMDELAALFTSKISEFEKTIPSAQQDNSTLASEFYAFKTFIMKAVSNLKCQIELIYHTLEDIEMRSRSNILLLHGLPENDNESLVEHFTSTCNIQMQLSHVTVGTFSACHRIGKNTSTEKPRPVLIRFSDNSARHEVWLAKRLLKGTGLTLSEFLTPARHALFLEARKALGVKGCWTMDGKIVAVCPDGKRKKIGSMADLKAVIALRDGSLPTDPPTASPGSLGVVEKQSSAQKQAASVIRAPNPARTARTGGASARGGKAPKTK